MFTLIFAFLVLKDKLHGPALLISMLFDVGLAFGIAFIYAVNASSC